MRKRIFSLFTALALCLVLLPGTALAEGGPGVSINSTPLESGKQYVAGEYGVIEKPADAPADTPYLDYRDGVLTVHGQMDLKSSSFLIDGAVTFTGGGDSCLETGSIHFNNGTLTLSGSMDFKPQGFTSNYSTSSLVSKLTTTDDYSGDIAIQGTSTSVLLDVQSSASISIGGNVSYFSSNTPADPITLKSAGDISTNMLQYHTITIEGKNVSLMHSPVFTGKSLTVKAAENVTVPNCAVLFLSGNYTEAVSVDISAGGNVEITNNGILMQAPPDGRTDSLTIRDAKSVSIQGKTNEYNSSLLPVSVTFVNCGSVTVTDTGNGEILKEGVPVTSDCPWTATAGGKTVTIPSGTWTYGGTAPANVFLIGSDVTSPTCWKAGEGWMFYEPPAEEGAPAKLTLDGATYNERITIQKADSVQLELKGENTFKEIGANAPLTLTGSGSFKGILYTSAFTNHSTGALNALVGVEIPNNRYYSNTVYGKYNTSDISGFYVTEESPCTIAEGAVLTVDTENGIHFDGLGSLTNNGTIINNSTILIAPGQDAADADFSAFIKGLKLTGTGTVTVEKMVSGSGPVTETYTNSGLKQLDPAGTLDLKDADSADSSHWEDQGYKWEVLETDPDDPSTITKAKLTLAPGFNASEVVLPDATVEIETQGESTIGKLSSYYVVSPDNAHADKTKLTLSGAGLLKIQQHVEISGGTENSLTVSAGAQVEVTGGITVGAAAGVDGTVTVNGTLTARADGGTAVLTGKVSVGPSGRLEVYGETGVFLGGKSTDDVNKTDFTNAFLLAPGGRFTGNCEIDIIAAQRSSGGLIEESLKAEDAIVIPNGYLPQGLAPVFNGDRTKLSIPGGGPFNISADNVPAPPRPSEGSGGSGGSGGGSGSGGEDDGGRTYAVTVERAEHGSIRSSHARASAGNTVTLTAAPDSGYGLDALTVTDSRGGGIRVTARGGGKYVFAMPERDVTVRASFKALEDCPSRAFSDLDTGAWYHEAVDYVLRDGLMNGYANGTFRPNGTLTRAQFAQILYNQAGRPAAAGEAPFTDVAPDAWCAPAIAWAAEQGVASGYGGGLFGPDDPVTREQLAVMLWRRAGGPAAPEGGELAFTDAGQIGAHAREALRWAVQTGVMSGKGGGVLDPKGPATRAQTASMLRNFLENGQGGIQAGRPAA